MARAKKQDPVPKPVAEEELEENEEEDEEPEEENESEDEDQEDDESEEEEEETNEDDSSSARESIRKLLEPFGKDQLIDLLKDAALKDPSLLSRISSTPALAEDAAPSDPALRKIFVYGLGYDATTEDLSTAFSPFGDIEDCRAVADRTTNRCKGFGFVLFRTVAAANKALREPQKKIGNRTTSCQLATIGGRAAAPAPTHPFLFGQGMNPAIGLMGQGMSPGMGLMGQGLNRTDASAVTYGGGLGFNAGQAAINTVSPSVIGRYGSPSTLQDTGRYQSSLFSSAGLQDSGRYQTGLYSAAAAMRDQSSDGSLGSRAPSYYGPY